MDYKNESSNLVATFQDYSAAREAARELETSGIPSDAVHIDSNKKTAGAGSSGYQEQHHQSTGFAGWWERHFGSSHDDDDAQYDRNSYETALASGSAILYATVPMQMVDSAVDILNRKGAVDVDRDARSGDVGHTDRGTPAATDGKIDVVEEDLQVGKRTVRRGGVRVYSRVVDQPIEEKVNLREEHVNVERRKVNREISPEDVSALRDQTIEVVEMAEEPVISKRARVREEVVVGKESTERTETVRDNVRHTEVEVEQLKADSQPSNTARSAKRDSSTDDLTSEYRRNFKDTYGFDSDFETMRPAYEYGYNAADDSLYRNRSWDQVENDLRSGYERRNPSSAWNRARSAVRYGWEKATVRL